MHAHRNSTITSARAVLNHLEGGIRCFLEISSLALEVEVLVGDHFAHVMEWRGVCLDDRDLFIIIISGRVGIDGNECHLFLMPEPPDEKTSFRDKIIMGESARCNQRLGIKTEGLVCKQFSASNSY